MIPTVQESEDLRAYSAEQCCFCLKPTRTWTNLPERKGGEQVACCPPCSRACQPSQVPSKRAWCDLDQARQWARGTVYDWEERSPAWRRVQEGIRQRRARADL